MSDSSLPPEFSNIRELIEACHDEIKRRAKRQMARENSSHSWHTTVLVNELVLKLLESKSRIPLTTANFFPFAYRSMRNILVDHFRSRSAKRRNPEDLKQCALDLIKLRGEPDEKTGPTYWGLDAWLDFEQLCSELPQQYSRQIEVFRRRICGEENKAIAQELGISESQATADFKRFKALLAARINPKRKGDGDARK